MRSPLPLVDILRVLRTVVPDQQIWWPASCDFEIVLGAILTQNTSWTQVEKAIHALKEASYITAESIYHASDEHMMTLIRPCGYWKKKAHYIRCAARWFLDHHGRVDSMDTSSLRSSLLKVTGIGEETADDICLYLYRRPVFIYDSYARGLLAQAGYGRYKSYAQARKNCASAIERQDLTVDQLAQLHGLIVEAGKEARRYGGWEIYWSTMLLPILEAQGGRSYASSPLD